MRGLVDLVRGDSEARTINDTDVPWISATKAGEITVDELTALNLSAVWACQTLIADAIATLPVDTYRKSSDGTRVEVDTPGWITKPNPVTLRVDYETQRLLSLLGWGNAYALLVRKNGTADPLDPIVERWLLDPWTVVCLLGPDGKVAYRVNGVDVPSGRIQHTRGYTLPGRATGLSVIEYARRSLGLGTAADRFGETFFANGVTPTGVLQVPSLPADVSKDVVDRLRDTFLERYAGTGNSRKPLVLTGGTQWQQIMVDPQSAQFLETRQFQIEEIARWYRVPPHEIQRISNNASQGGGMGIEAQSLNLAQRTLLPWTVRLEQSDTELMVRGQYEKLNLNAFVRADIKTRWEVHQIARNIGVHNADEIRALEDEDPIPGGDGEAYWQPANFIEVGAEPTTPVVPPAEPPAAGDTQGAT